MPRFAANLSMLFAEHAFLDRFGAAARSGFRAVELQFPYAFPADRIADRLDTYQLDLVLHNLPAGDWAAGERGIACHPDRKAEFEDGVGEALMYATRLGVKRLNCLAGIQPPGVSREHACETLVGNLRYAARELGRRGIKLLIEPVNTFDVPGFFVSGSSEAIRIIEETGSDNLYLQYDVYHMQRMEGELSRTFERHLERIAHVQVADNPLRHEPGTGEINYRFLFDFIDRCGYDGWVGCEYLPAADTVGGLRWLGTMRGAASTKHEE